MFFATLDESGHCGVAVGGYKEHNRRMQPRPRSSGHIGFGGVLVVGGRVGRALWDGNLSRVGSGTVWCVRTGGGDDGVARGRQDCEKRVLAVLVTLL